MSIKDENFVDDFARYLERNGVNVSRDIYKIITRYLERNSNDKGEILRTPKQVNFESRRLLKRYFKSDNYQGFLGKFADGFRRVLDSETFFQFDLNKIVFSDSFIQNEMNPILTEFLKETKLLVGEIGYNSKLVSPVARALTIAVKKGLTINEAEKVVKRLTIGTKANKGDFVKYTQQTARDVIYGYDGQINKTIAESYGLQNIRYVGSIVQDSRLQCKKWLKKKVIKGTELKKEINWAKSKGSGMVKSTNTNNFIRLRGGYNCRHRAIPIN